MAQTRPEVRPLCGAGGAEIAGIDLSQQLDSTTTKLVRDAFRDHIALFFLDQHISPADMTRFVGSFGELLEHPYLDHVDGYQFIHEVRKTPGQTVNFGYGWHADFTFLERPSLANALYSREGPDFGGDTIFINSYLAYEALSPAMQRMLQGLRAVHRVHARYLTDVDVMSNKKGDVVEQQTLHPLVRTHPETARKCLYFNPSFCPQLEGMTEEESRPLLSFLTDWVGRPDFQIRYRWKKDVLGIWDNRCSLHTALNDYQGKLRVMHRALAMEPSRPQ